MLDFLKGKEYGIGVVLGGGGARGFSHLGVLKALEERNIKIDVISGVSAGAIIGAMYSHGKTPEEIHKILKDKGLFDYSKIHLPVNGLLKLDGLLAELEKTLPEENIEDLPIPLIVTISNLNLGSVEYRKKGPLAQTLLASSSIPILFEPIEMDGYQYVDGGLFDNLPVKPLKGLCKKIIAINVSPINKAEQFQNLIQVAQRIFQLSINQRSEENKKLADIVIEPDGIRRFNTLDNNGTADELFEIGYKHAKKMEIT